MLLLEQYLSALQKRQETSPLSTQRFALLRQRGQMSQLLSFPSARLGQRDGKLHHLLLQREKLVHGGIWALQDLQPLARFLECTTPE